jgi:hypothetical protein
MAIEFRQKASLHGHLLKNESVIFKVKVNSNATPANKVLETDIPDVAILRCQGQTAEADAIESGIAFTTPVDATGICGLLFDDQVEKIYQVNVTPSVGTVVVTSGVSAGGRLFLNIDSNQDFSSASVELMVELKYNAKI